MGALYRIRFPNGKAYLGITNKTAAERFAVHARDSRKPNPILLYRAFRKHGIENAKLETLVIADDWQYLCDLEIKAIAAFGTRSPLGYNATDGGEGNLGCKHRIGMKHSAETRAMMSANRRGKRKSEQGRKNIAAALVGNKYALGVKHTEKARMNMAAGHFRSDAPRSNGASGVRGVSWCKSTRKWRAHITVAGKMKTLGRYDDINEAAAVRRSAQAEHLRSLGGA